MTSPPVDGEANAAVIELLAKTLGVAQRRGRGRSPARASRRKTVRVAGVIARGDRGARVKRLLVARGLARVLRGNDGTLDVSLTTAPGSHVLDGVADAARHADEPARRSTTATRGASGFDLALDLDGERRDRRADRRRPRCERQPSIAAGASPPFPLGRDRRARSSSTWPRRTAIGAAPVALDPPRAASSAWRPLTYGAVLAGGRDATGAPSDAIAIYNAFDHSLVGGLAAARAAQRRRRRRRREQGIVYLFGGNDAAGAPTGQPVALRHHRRAERRLHRLRRQDRLRARRRSCSCRSATITSSSPARPPRSSPASTARSSRARTFRRCRPRAPACSAPTAT